MTSMARWERTIDQRTEHWELVQDGVVLTEREGGAGTEVVVRSATCDTEAMAESIAARMVARQERAGFVRARAEPAREATPVGVPLPSHPVLTEKQLASLINGVAKAVAGDAHKVGLAVAKVVADRSQHLPSVWFLVAHQLVPAERMPGLWDLLGQRPALVQPEALFDLLSRLPTGAAFKKLFKGNVTTSFTPAFDRSLDELLFAAYQKNAALFDAREGELPANVREALDFVRGRSGVPLSPGRANLVLRHIAEAQCTRGLATNWELPRVEAGEVTRPRVATRHDVREVALRFGSLEAWRAAMAEAVQKAPELSVAAQYDGLFACSLGVLAQKLASAFSFNDNSNLAQILALLEARADAPEALVEAAQSIPGTQRHALEVRDMLAVIAAGRFGAAGAPVPEALDALLDLSFFSGVYFESLPPYVAGMTALPRERALRLAERRLAEPHLYAPGLAPLLAHDDEALLTRFFDKDATNAYLDPLVVGRLGARALPHLARVWDTTQRSSRRARHRQVLEVLATMGDRNETADAAWDRFFTFDQEGDETLRHWDPSYALLRARALAALPMSRRTAVLVHGASARPFPERALAAAETLDEPGLSRVVEAFLARRSEPATHALLATLRGLGARLVAPLRAHRALFADDAAFVTKLREALGPGVVAAVLG